MPIKINFKETPTYKREYKKLCKRYPSFKADIDGLKKDIRKTPILATELQGILKKYDFQ